MDELLKDQLSLFGQLEESPGKVRPKVVEVERAPAKKASRRGAEKGTKIGKPAPAASRKSSKAAGAQMTPKAPAKTYAAGLVPAGDVRLTINIRQDLHLRLKIAAAHGRTTIGEIIEELVEQYVA
jgi:hypothetical protein